MCVCVCVCVCVWIGHRYNLLHFNGSVPPATLRIICTTYIIIIMSLNGSTYERKILKELEKVRLRLPRDCWLLMYVVMAGSAHTQ